MVSTVYCSGHVLVSLYIQSSFPVNCVMKMRQEHWKESKRLVTQKSLSLELEYKGNYQELFTLLDHESLTSSCFSTVFKL